MSYSAIRPDGTAVYPAVQSDSTERLSFIRKVYGLVFLGLLFFSAVITLPIIGHAAGIPVLSELYQLAWVAGATPIGVMVSLGLLIGSSYFVHRVAMVRGWNLVAFFFMAGFWGVLTVPLVAWAIGTSGIAIVMQALGLTCLVFGGLSAYVLISRKDFSFMGGFLAMGTMLVLGIIVLMLFWSMFGGSGQTFNLLHIGLSIVIVLLFSGWVLYDTSKMLHHYATDMVVPAALGLMVDFIILFREILFLLVISRD